jgi:hypothetical protein
MIHHIVMLDLHASHDHEERAAIMQGLDALRSDLEGFERFAHGPNRDYEKLSPDCSYVFTCSFADEAGLQRYLADQKHQALGRRLIAICNGGLSGLCVVDMEEVQ